MTHSSPAHLTTLESVTLESVIQLVEIFLSFQSIELWNLIYQVMFSAHYKFLVHESLSEWRGREFNRKGEGKGFL